MTYRFMRIIDDYLGMLLCRLIAILMQIAHLLLPRHRQLENSQVRRILVQKYFGMGSVLQAIPLLNVLRRNYPQARITFITTGSNRELLTLCHLADDVLVIDFSSPITFLLNAVRTFGLLLTSRFDLSVDLEFFAKFPLLVAAASRAPIRVGLYHRKMRPAGILTHKVSFNFYRHISEIYLGYAARLDLQVHAEDTTALLPSFRPECEADLRSRFHLKDTERFIVVNVNAGDLFAFRKWPGRQFASLLGSLLERHPDYRYLLIGGSGEFGYVDAIVKLVAADQEKLLNCAGKTTLKELFALIEMADLVITNDSGPLHIASLYGKNLAAFFGPETPVVYGPRNSNALVFYPDDLYCSPCMCVYDSKQSLYAETCEENICLSSLLPDQVIAALEERFLNAPTNAP